MTTESRCGILATKVRLLPQKAKAPTKDQRQNRFDCSLHELALQRRLEDKRRSDRLNEVR